MLEQKIIEISGAYTPLNQIVTKYKTIMLIADECFEKLQICNYINYLQAETKVRFVVFREFESNPKYESVVKAVEIFQRESCEAIMAIGGGSTIDLAKCIKLFSNMKGNQNYLRQMIVPNDIELIVLPTTAGTGSEATRFAVIYYEGRKQSVSDSSCIPNTVIFDASVLMTLSEYQKKATMMDALCHGIESFWSVNADEESREYSKRAIQLVLENKKAYLNNEYAGNRNMLEAANLAGKAINIAETTAGHAMCYKLTSIYGIAHGHAAALCVSKLFQYMANFCNENSSERKNTEIILIFENLAKIMNCKNVDEAVIKLQGTVDELGFTIPYASEADYEILKQSVNQTRLKNNPIALSEETIDYLYHQILERGQDE